VQVLTNFLIGENIVEHEHQGALRAAYGKQQLTNLSRKLTREFGRGYSADNLMLMRLFFLTYQNHINIAPLPISETVSRKSQKIRTAALRVKTYLPISETVSRISFYNKHFLKLSWSHFILLMKMNEEERGFYEIESVTNNWSVRELERQYNSSLYERLSLSKNRKKIREMSWKGQIMKQPEDFIRQPYILEFLGLKEESSYSESELESAIINRIEEFLLELGKGFLFEARQKRITLDGEDYRIDLVFYNRLLRCYVLIDLKIGKLTHQDIGQMQMYVHYFDREIKLQGEHPSIGIILCKQNNRTVVEFTLPEKQKQIYAREYKLYLPSKEELKKQIEKVRAK
jgi:predicted nuclease of restriction endonuclease-like (RecB) superfamily